VASPGASKARLAGLPTQITHAIPRRGKIFSETEAMMIPTEKQIEEYFHRLELNIQDLKDLLNEAAANLGQIFIATDPPPLPEGESLAGMVLEAALGLALPEGPAFFAFVNHMIEGAKKMKEKVEEMSRYEKIVDKAIHNATESAAKDVSTAYRNGAMNMIDAVNAIRDRIYSWRGLNERLRTEFLDLHAHTNTHAGAKAAEPVFKSINWDKLPGLVADKSDVIRYVFTYILARLAVFRFVRLKMHRQSNPFDLALTELLVTKIEPEGISQAGCTWIFTHFNKVLDDSTSPGAVLPVTNIVPILNPYDMIDNWYPDITISQGTHEEQVAAMVPGRRHFTPKMLAISMGLKKLLPEVRRTPEFHLAS
jgi:hypothetical protein